MASNAPPSFPQEEEDGDEDESTEDGVGQDDEDYAPPGNPQPAAAAAAARGGRRPRNTAAAVVVVEDGETEEEEEDAAEAEDNGGEGGGRKKDSNGLERTSAGGNEGLGLDLSSAMNCPVCFEMWRSDGPHRVCCIPCGHVYGRSCLEKWLHQSGKNIGKCPQCNRKFRRKEIISLYAPQIAVPNDDLEKELHSQLEKVEHLKSEKAQLLEELKKYKEITCLGYAPSEISRKRLFGFHDDSWTSPDLYLSGSNLESRSSHNNGFRRCNFILQNEVMIDGARVMAIDASSQIVVVSGKAPGTERNHVLSKISLLTPGEVDKIKLPPDTRAIRDLCILPNRLALLASLGRKLLLFSMESNNLVLKYDLPDPAWSCSGDGYNPYHIYAGLQSGALLVFDIRQTAEPLQAIEGLTKQPIHTVHSILCGGGRKVLTASSMGPCLWELDSSSERPYLIPGLENQGVCISLACGSSHDDIVASFRPKVELPCDGISSQTTASPSPVFSGSGRLGSHVLMKRVNSSSYERCEVGHSSVSGLRMSKSAIISTAGSSPLFAYGDESSHTVRIWALPRFQVCADLKPHQHPILDLKCERQSTGPGFLGCVSEDRLQVFKYS